MKGAAPIAICDSLTTGLRAARIGTDRAIFMADLGVNRIYTSVRPLVMHMHSLICLKPAMISLRLDPSLRPRARGVSAICTSTVRVIIIGAGRPRPRRLVVTRYRYRS